MTESLTTLFSKASRLDPTDRAALAGMLIGSLEPAVDESVEAAWTAEIERRMAEVDRGAAQTLAWDALQRRLDARGQARGRR